MVHGGFYWRFLWQKCWIKNQVQLLLKKHKLKKLFVTGHSLGGAIATLAAPYLVAETSGFAFFLFVDFFFVFFFLCLTTFVKKETKKCQIPIVH